MKEEVSEFREKCYYLELEKNKLLKMVEKLKAKCKKSESAETKKVFSNNGMMDSHDNGEPCSLFCCCEKEIGVRKPPPGLQKCCSFKVGTNVECSETSVPSSELHSEKLNYLYEGDNKHNNQDKLGQSQNHHKSSSGASFPSPLLNGGSDNNIYMSNNAVLTDDGVHKLCITTTDGMKTKFSNDKKGSKEQHSKIYLRKKDENIRAPTIEYRQRNEERNSASSKAASRHLVQAYVGGSGDSGLSLEDSSSASPSGSNKVSTHSESKFESSDEHSSPKTNASLTTRPRRSLRIASSRQQKHNHVIENGEDEFMVIPSLRREDDESSTPLTSEGSITDENEEKKVPCLGEEDKKGPKENSKTPESFRPRSQIRRIDDEEEDDDDEDNALFDNASEAPIYQYHYERNVMLEEATTVGAEQISIGSLKRQFALTATDQNVTTVPSLPAKLRSNNHRKSSSGSNDEGMVMDGDRFSSSSGSNKSARSRHTSTSSKSLKQMEDEFSSEFAENELRTVSRKSIVSRNSMIFAESIGSDEDNKDSDNDEGDREAQFSSVKSFTHTSFERNSNENGDLIDTRDNRPARKSSSVEQNQQLERTQNSKMQAFIKENFLPPTTSKHSIPPTYAKPPLTNSDENILRSDSFGPSTAKDERKGGRKSPEVSIILFYLHLNRCITG